MLRPEALVPVGRVVKSEHVSAWMNAHAARTELENARTVLEQEKAQTLAAAHAEGLASGLEIGRNEASEFVIKTTLALRQRVRDIELQLPALVLDIVENILGEFEVGHLLGASIKRAMVDINSKTEITVQVSALDYDKVLQSVSEIMDLPGSPVIQVQSEDGVASGRCRLSGDFGSLDLSLTTQLEILRGEIHKAVAHANGV
jgi:type III secretion protein L